jgi:hypothetical protein
VPNVPSAEVQVIMPGRSKDLRPLAATGDGAIAPTMAGPMATTMRERESYPRGVGDDDD